MINQEAFDFLGITSFHKAGYTGKNVTIASKETIIEGVFDDVICLKPRAATERNLSEHAHGTLVMDFIRQVAPAAKKIAVGLANGSTKNNVFYSEELDYIRENMPDIMTCSVSRTKNDVSPAKAAIWKELLENDCFLCCAVGNESEEGCISLAESDMWKSIGACSYPKLNKAYYSSVCEHLDFMSLSGLKTEWKSRKYNGTSFASPLFAGMLALIQDFFISNTGKKLNNEQLLQFIKDNCKDLGDSNRDNYYGYGLFILPNPYSIDINKYIGGEEEMEIKMKIGCLKATVDGKEVMLDCAPDIVNNRTLVPIRFVAETLGCTVDWNEKEREIIIVK